MCSRFVLFAQGMLAGLVLASGPRLAQAQTQVLSGQWQTTREWRLANPLGPAPAFAPRSRWRSTLDLKSDTRLPLPEGRSLSLHAEAALTVLHDDGTTVNTGNTTGTSRVNALYATTDHGDWQLSAGRRLIGWDVGQGFRPNDVVQREERRPLLPATPQGRGVVQVEHFGADDATSLVWVDPQRGHAGRRSPCGTTGGSGRWTCTPTRTGVWRHAATSARRWPGWRRTPWNGTPRHAGCPHSAPTIATRRSSAPVGPVA